ncbi:MAG TPA: MBL fold metallo-hydrolase, partial [Chitinophagales bacterium]|nr:MBL fold metallo-hydrolase [Chitinophagales bacterium]
MQIQFCGAARTVTGSCHLIQFDNGFRLLLDCGLFQGRQAYVDEWNATFPFDPKDIDAVILSHAHIDHCGRLPKLVKDGFRGFIYCTPATADLCEHMLLDSAFIQEKDAEFHNKKRRAENLPPIPPLYTPADVPPMLGLFKRVNYEETFPVADGVSAFLRDAGHILGSASVTMKYRQNGKDRALGFTGDIGRPARPILRDPAPMDDVDYLLTESTYGNRVHEGTPDDKERLLKIVLQTCVEQKGKIIIPAFSVGRTQEIVYMLDQLHAQKRLPRLKMYVDSPLSTNATNVYRAHPECFDADISKYIQNYPNPFGFNDLIYVTDVNDSKRLNFDPEPCIIVSSSGMAEAGRVVHHIRNNVENPNNTVLIVGYCAEGSLGARLRKRPEFVKIFGEEKKVNASIEIMDSFSAHADKKEILAFLEPLDRERMRKVFLVHGDFEDAQLPLEKTLYELGYKNVYAPQMSETIELA